MRLVRFRFGDRIATGAAEFEADTIRVLKGTFFEDPLPTGEEVPFDDVRLLAPVLPSKLVCVGKNYAAHAAEFDSDVPEEPLLFLKPSTAVIGPNDPMTLLPGDAILTGTPEGVGKLSPGDVVEVEVDGIGTLANPVEAA